MGLFSGECQMSVIHSDREQRPKRLRGRVTVFWHLADSGGLYGNVSREEGSIVGCVQAMVRVQSGKGVLCHCQSLKSSRSLTCFHLRPLVDFVH